MRRDSTKAVGTKGEDLAADYLVQKNYSILERNYRWSRGEIDIVACKDDVLIFVEVKTATGGSFGAPETWVTERKQKQVGQVAEGYLQEHELDNMDCRFDVIAIQMRGKEWQVKHIENAFWL
ncbi:MAG: YraN family protein [Calditrichaeota bacterium]|nr:YraN family protein [candidate division KSB1 bacterium]MCZ6820869.1 YraN family protein [Calditrichota bacterium]TDI85867.1 MAG: YraN family protein [Caldithrix sp.]